jgi:hypothetical protein
MPIQRYYPFLDQALPRVVKPATAGTPAVIKASENEAQPELLEVIPPMVRGTAG